MKKSTVQLLEMLKKCNSLNEYIKENESEFSTGKPCDRLNEEIGKRNLSKAEVIRNSGIERHYAYQILSGAKTPSRDKVLMFCFGLKMSAEETQHLLLECSVPLLYAKNKRDNVILFALENKLSIIELNELLYELGLDIFE
ncbi:MAG TPA: hypothetical protein DCY15_05755 [Ruminococcaceae bacterium]|nr:hypothetical protein [Oscillospiraceae bacterium]